MPEPRPSPEAQVVAIRATLIDTYGEDYAGEDVAAAIDLLFRHQAEHEANVQRLRQSKNEALERAEAQVAALRRELAERKANAEGICIDLEQWKARAQLAEAELSDLQERVQKLTATRIGDFRLVPATEILAALAAPETPGATREGCDDPDCSRTECLHLGTCWEDAMDPPETPGDAEMSPETTPDAPTTERVGLHEPDWLRARTPGEPPYPRATTTHELSALTGHRDTPSSEASSDAPTGGED